MAMEASRLNIQMNFLDSTGSACPAAQVVGTSTNRVIEGSLYDTSKLRALVDLGCDVVTMEIEHVGVDGLAQLESEGVNVQPCSRVVRLIQDKYAQKVRESLDILCSAFVIKSMFFCYILMTYPFVQNALNKTGLLCKAQRTTRSFHQSTHNRLD